jgi:DNA-binding transcriptional ArsR family regulator
MGLGWRSCACSPKNGELCACELLKKLSITQGTLSHHMKDLAASDIVVVRKEGKWCHYALNAVALFARWPTFWMAFAAPKSVAVRAVVAGNNLD